MTRSLQFYGKEYQFLGFLAIHLSWPIFGLTQGPSWWSVYFSAKTNSNTKDSGRLGSFPGLSVVRDSSLSLQDCKGHGFDLWLGNLRSHKLRHRQKKKDSGKLVRQYHRLVSPPFFWPLLNFLFSAAPCFLSVRTSSSETTQASGDNCSWPRWNVSMDD